MSNQAYILSVARTPVGSFQGELSSLRAPELGAAAVAAAVARGNVDPETVDEVILGNVISAGVRQAPARQAMRKAGLPDGCGATTVNKVCGSGMKATMLASDLVRAGSADIVVAGGMESMSNAPYLLPKVRQGLRMGHGEIQDAMFLDGLEDADTGASMGSFAQATADAYQLTRQAQDEFAIRSVERARAAMASGALAGEIVPVELNGATVTEDEQPRRARLERIAGLRPAFKSDGTITAANASSISDGASALVVAGEAALRRRRTARAHRRARHSLPRTRASSPSRPSEPSTSSWTGSAGRSTTWICSRSTKRSLWSPCWRSRSLHLDPERVNVYGGACAQGHPIGSTGSRLIVTLARALEDRGAKRGIAALCIGGGEATAIALERD